MFYNEYMPSFSLVGVTLCKDKVSHIGDSNDTSGNESAGASSRVPETHDHTGDPR